MLCPPLLSPTIKGPTIFFLFLLIHSIVFAFWFSLFLVYCCDWLMIIDLSGHNQQQFFISQAAHSILLTALNFQHVWDSNIFSSSLSPYYYYYWILIFHAFWSIVVSCLTKMASNSQEKNFGDFMVSGAILQTCCACHIHPSKGHKAQASSAAVVVVKFAGRWSSVVQLFLGMIV